MPSSAGRRGVILVLVSGVSVLLLFTAMLLLQYGLFAAKGSASKVSGAQAGLAACSGMDYAAARLAGGVYPRFSTSPADRGDDPAYRDGSPIPLSRSENPSFSHGEHWLDQAGAGSRLGAYDGGIDSLLGAPDLDRSGSFTAWSGRLRGGGGPFGSIFSLRVDAREAKIPVNGGILADNPATPPPTLEPQSLALSCHRGIAHAVNGLGAQLLAAGTHRRDDASSGASGDGEPIQICWIGTDLIRGRPAGGYRSLEQVRASLRASGYPDASIDPILPHLDLGPYPLARGGAVSWGGLETLPTISLAAAPATVLKALWMYAAVPFRRSQVPDPPFPVPGIPWTTTFSSRSGSGNLVYGSSLVNFPSTYDVVAIWPDEAGLLAGLADGLRRQGPCSWNRLRAEIRSQAGTLFAQDLADWSASPQGAFAWRFLKSEAAFHAVSPDPPPFPYLPMSFGVGGFDYEPGLPGVQVVNAINHSGRGEIRFPSYPQLAYPAAPAPGPNAPFVIVDPLRGLELSMAPPVRFQVGSRGAHGGSVAGIEGDLRAADLLEMASQEDFEGLTGFPRLLAGGIEAQDPAPAERRAWLSDSGRSYPHVKSYPRYNPHRAPGVPYSALYGGLGLADRELGPRSAETYHAFGEDWSGDTLYRFFNEPGLAEPLWASATGDTTFDTNCWSATRYPGTFQNRVERFRALFDPNPGTPYVSFASIELWVVRAPVNSSAGLVMSGPNRIEPSGNSGVGVRSSVAITNGTVMRFNVIVNSWCGYWPPNPGPSFNMTQATPTLPDWNPADGSRIQTGHYHIVVTFEKLLATVKTRIRVYVNGAKTNEFDYPAAAASPSSYMVKPEMYFAMTPYLAIDELRCYGTCLADAEVLALYKEGRFARPRGGPAAAPATLLAERPAAPPNPTYRSPAFRLGPGGRLERGSWTGWTADDPDVGGDLADKARIRCVALGFDADGNLVGSAELGDAGAVADLASIRNLHSFRYAVEFYSPTGGDPGPLYDTPVFESVWFTVQRRGISPGWSAWQER